MNILTILSFIVFSSFGVANVVDAQDYTDLVTYAKTVSFAYCVKHGMTTGMLTDKSTHCTRKTCKDKEFKGLEVIETFNFNDLGDVGAGFYAVDHDYNRIVLAFRGTSSRRDWFANIDTMPRKYQPLINLVERETIVECDGCKVHRGFYNFLQKNCAGILSSVKRLKEEYPDHKLVVIGHSLGASFALLSGIEFSLMKLDPLVVTYASPKIGNQQFIEFVDRIFDTENASTMSIVNHEIGSGYIRVVHKDDMVPNLPPTGIFRHGGVEYYIDKSDIPHKANNLVRKGASVDEWSVTESPMKYIPNGSVKNAHSHYFLKITGCK